ncbi:hypothetical protein [Parasitella parasitica]|uniref:ABC1 atypical kinase-like domain-containing protein n=1 Tax=Parasitella parasitica TaxID=35722 RepID=A0A0B7MR26_9FUNG|nr:hypothetical protein [Parasitella parasitica]
MNQSRLFIRSSSLLCRRPAVLLWQRHSHTALQHGQSHRKNLARRIVNGAAMVTLVTTVTVGVGSTILYKTNDRFRHVANALERCGIAGAVGAKVAVDYQRTLSKEYSDEAAYEEAKRACHQRCAERVLAAVQRLGGVYVKLGQHISVMQYLLPNEWCQTMRVLQDQCDPTPPQDIQALFLSDFGLPVEQVFEEFDYTPLGVASLAQVHRARLSKQSVQLLDENERWIDQEDRWVAVKLQHPYLDEYCQLDMDTVSFIFEIVKRVFPNFGFDWFAEEMRESIPKELDFVHETQNARRVQANFAEDSNRDSTSLVIPRVVWAKRRIMCMEYPGNVFIRPAKNPKHSKHNFDLVLLDHGLYRDLSEDLRSNYAHLWTSLIKADEEGIRKYSYRVGGTDIYQLFACMLTGREWDKISQSNLNSVRESDEVGRMSDGAMTYLAEVADILGKLPRPVLLLLKTNDLLRHVDEKLNKVADDRITYVIMGSYCSKAVWLDTKKYIVDKIRLVGFSFHLLRHLFSAWWQYESLVYALWLYQYSARWENKLDWIKKKKSSTANSNTNILSVQL